MTTLDCLPGERGTQARGRGLGGIAGIEVDRGGRELRVLLLGKLPKPAPTAANLRVHGPGRPVAVVGVQVRPSRLPTRYDELLVRLDRLGDRNPYTLSLVATDRRGQPTGQPMAGLDPRRASAPFTFTADCADDVDCAPPGCPPAPATPGPALDYLAKDYASFRQLILDRLALLAPDWTDRQVPDFGVTIVEVLAYVGDQLSYAQDAVATEAYLGTARLRTSVRRHLRLVDYRMHDGCNARSWVQLTVGEPGELRAGQYWFVTSIPDLAGAPAVAAADVPAEKRYEVFEPLGGDLAVHPAHNRIRLWTWGGEVCCLPVDATEAVLVDAWLDPRRRDRRLLQLRAGDVLILEEVRGPVTGVPGDADRRHRQAVRLIAVDELDDPVFDQPLLRVRWAAEDALGFPLCLAAVGGEDCCLIEDVSVALGNVVLVDHGASRPACDGAPARLRVPDAEPGRIRCAGLGRPVRDSVDVRFRPQLRAAPLTRRAPHPDPAAVAARQADLLDGIPAAARAAVDRWLDRTAAGSRLLPDQLTQARILFGTRALAESGLADAADAAGEHRALRILLARSRTLLARRVQRLRQLAATARTGAPLSAATAAEIAAGWGARLATGLAPDSAVVAGPASTACVQDPAAALAQVWLESAGEAWTVRPDLLDSGPEDRHLVVEVDDEGASTLRFGDGRGGRAVTAGQDFAVRLRVGNGAAGNVGADTITHLVACGPLGLPVLSVRNPLPAVGGTDPEPVAEARLLGPTGYRYRLERAVVAADYSAVAAAVPGMQGVATDLAWTGSWYEADVAIDPAGRTDPPATLLAAVRARLEQVRRIGHDLRVDPPRVAPVDVALRVCLAPTARRAQALVALRAALGDRPGGLFDPDRLSFGSDLAVSRMVAAAMAVPGVLAVTVTRLARSGESGSEVPAGGVLAFGRLEIPTGGGEPGRPGALTLDLVGGR